MIYLMKFIILTLFLNVSLNLVAQSENVVGTYEFKHETTDGGVLKYTLALNHDGTFLFDSYTKDTRAIPPEKNSLGKGQWTLDNNIVTLMTSTKDVTESHALDLSHTKARFNRTSPRDLTDSIIKTKITIYSTNIFWLKGIELLRRD